MKRLVQKLCLAAVAAIAVGASEPAAQSNCAPNWTGSKYKSFGAIRNEINNQYGDVRILRVALCDEGGNAYFHVVIISGQGEVRRVQLVAAAK
jgi:hypothetical protein